VADGYSHIRIVGLVEDLSDVISLLEFTFPRLYGQLRSNRWEEDGVPPYVNFFVLDRAGNLLGSDAYTVGSRSPCCTALMVTKTPPGSHVYVLPQGYPFDAKLAGAPVTRRSPA
jgi:hypothetical protein